MSQKEKGIRDVVIETPRGCRNKYAYDEKAKAFRLKKVLPAGAVFPFDFGFLPGTKGGDGDPLDVLVILDEPAFPGCVVECRIIGALKALQSEKEGMERNDRLIGVAVASHTYHDIADIGDLNEQVRDEIRHFFISYNEQAGKRFEPKGWADAVEAESIIRKGS